MKIAQEILSLTLGLSALVGIQILVSDGWLWSAAQSHAFGLTGFVLIDIVLATVALVRSVPATIGASLISTVQLVAMTTDSTIGQPMDVSARVFRAYLFGDISFIGLLGIQIVILTISIALLAIPLAHRHARLRLRLPSKPRRG